MSKRYLADQVKILKIRLLAEAARLKKGFDQHKESVRNAALFGRAGSTYSDTREPKSQEKKLRKLSTKIEPPEPPKFKIPEVGDVPKYLNNLKPEEMESE